MKTDNQPLQDRRRFIKSCLRLAACSGLLITGAMLGSRDKRVGATADECVLSIPCKGCTKFSGCGLSRAQEIKKSARGKAGDRAES